MSRSFSKVDNVVARKRGTPQGKKTGGRTKGTPNKRSLELLQGLMAHGCIPAEQIAKLLTSNDLHAAQKMESWEKLLPYLFPQRKPVDPDGYLTAEQAAGMLGAQATKFRDALQQHVGDAAIIALVLESLRASSKPESPR
jgi:hypothetical protein